jgi:molybdenum cofactor guanylyltransferase
MTSSAYDNLLNKGTPTLNGLVLAGGKSSRMGKDKGSLRWHAKEQRFHMADLLHRFCNEVFISCRQEQQEELTGEGYKVIPDAYEGLGPYGAILSAFKHNENTAWLVVACDLPLLNYETISQLVNQRNPSLIATTFKSPHDSLPEPLVTIWEPTSYSILLSSLAKGYQCPRKALINNRVEIIEPLNPEALINVNTPQELERVWQLLSNAAGKLQEDY